MKKEQLKNIIEAALIAQDKPLDWRKIEALFAGDEGEVPDKASIRAALEALQQDYQGRGIELKEVASGFRVQIRAEYSLWIHRLFDNRIPRYSRALLETLAIIAYRQPITRAEIEDIRGVSISSSIIRTLQDRDWIRVVGHRNIPGKPGLLGTTRSFLDYFNLTRLSDLPALREVEALNEINPDLFELMQQQGGEAADASLEEGDHGTEKQASNMPFPV